MVRTSHLSLLEMSVITPLNLVFFVAFFFFFFYIFSFCRLFFEISLKVMEYCERTGLHKGVFVVPDYVNNILGTNIHI